jgi:hypothetical protein
MQKPNSQEKALEHPKFKEMIDVASCATQGVKSLG